MVLAAVLSAVLTLTLAVVPVESAVVGQPGNAVVLDFHAEAAVGFSPTRLRWRSNARGPPGSGGRTVWLKEDRESLSFAICLPRASEVQVQEVRFSSDGWKKEGAVMVDGEEVGVVVLVGLWKKEENWWVFLYFLGFVLGVEERKTGGLSVFGVGGRRVFMSLSYCERKWTTGRCSCRCRVLC